MATTKAAKKSKKPVTLATTKETFIVVEGFALQDFIVNFYKRDFGIQADQECSDESNFCIDATEELDEFEISEVEEFIESGEGCGLLQALVKDLVAKGAIEKGQYLVQCSFG